MKPADATKSENVALRATQCNSLIVTSLHLMEAARRLIVHFMVAALHPVEDYGEMLHLMREAAACNPGDVVMPMLSSWALDRWATNCEKTDASQEYEFPSLEWLDSFAGASDILSVSREDASGDLPHDCERESVQFLAWEFAHFL